MGVSNRLRKMLRLLFLSTLVAIAASQACDEGWVQYEHHHHCSCFYVSPNEEKTTGRDADLICNAQGGWVIELHDTTMNMFVKEQLIKRYEPQYLIPAMMTATMATGHGLTLAVRLNSLTG